MRVAAFFWLSVLLGCTLSSSALGQVQLELPRTADQQLGNAFLPAPRALRQHVSRAQQAMQQQRYSDAVLELGAVLAVEPGPGDLPAQDYFVAGDDPRAVYTSLRSEAERLLGKLPRQGRELYELQFGGDARALLDQAIAAGDLQQIAEVSRRFFHTQAGYEATLLLGRAQLDQGKPVAAALCFQRLTESSAAQASYDPELSILLASCWLYAGMPAKAEATLRDLKQRQPQATIRLGDRTTHLFDKQERALAWLEDLLGGHGGIEAAIASQWLMVGGNAARNARSAGGLPLLRYRWRVPTVNDPAEERVVRQLHKQYISEQVAALPVLQPLAVQDVVLMRTPDRVIAVDFQSGKRIWEFPWFESSPEELEGRLGEQGDSESLRELQLNQRLWDDAAYGQLSSDGKLAFFIDELGYAGGLGSQVLVAGQGMLQVNPGAPRTHNRLVAVELETQGKLRWLIGGESGEDEPRLAGAFFLGPPLPLLGQLYVLAEINGEIRLVVLEAETGQLAWSQQLAHVDTATIENDQQRRLAGATPSFADGVLICPTSAGAVVAVDIVTRSLRWGYQYKHIERMRMHFGFSTRYQQQGQQSGQRWADAIATLADGRVLLTPPESGQLHCLDLVSGDVLWERDREDLLYVACVHEGKVMLVGASQVLALELTTGQTAWTQPISARGALPSGRGFYSDGHYYLPCTTSELLKLELEQGEIVSRIETDQVLGNLICYRDQILSLGVDWLSAYYQLEPLQKRIEQLLVANPDDAWALARQGELLLQQGKRREALASLRKAHLIDQGDDTTRVLLVQTLLEALREDFAANRRMAEEVEQLIDQPDQYAQYLRLMGMGLQETGQTMEAFDSFLKLVDLLSRSTHSMEGTEPEMARVEPQWQVRLDRWLQGRIQRLLAAAETAERATMDEVIQKRLDEALRSDSSEALRQFATFFGAHQLADHARLEMARRMIQSRELLGAELLLARLQDSSEDTVAAEATGHLAVLLAQSDQMLAATTELERLAQQWPEVVCYEGKTGQALHDEMISRADFEKTQQLRKPWPHGEVEVTQHSHASSRYSRALFRLELQQSEGSLPAGTQLLFDQSSSLVKVRDPYGTTWLEISLKASETRRVTNHRPARAALQGHLLVISTGMELIAINCLQSDFDSSVSDQVLWRAEAVTSFYGSGQTNTKPRSIPNPLGEDRHVTVDSEGRVLGRLGPVTEAGVVYLRSRTLYCVQPLTGRTVWMREGVEAGSALFGDEELVLAVSPTTHVASVFSAVDGQLLGERQLEPEDQRWATVGRRVLALSQAPDEQLTLRLYDAWNEEEIWSRTFAAGSKGQLIEFEEVAVVQPDGKLLIMPLDGEQPLLEAQVQAESPLQSLHVLRSQQQYIVTVSGPPSSKEVRGGPPATEDPLINGQVYAINRQTGKPDWQSPVAIENFGFPLDQPTELPILLFMRQVHSRANNRIDSHSSLLCLDRRDGRVLLRDDDIRPQNFSYEIAADPSDHSVVLQVSQKQYKIHMTDKAIAPVPPAQIGTQSSLYMPDRVSEVAGAVWNILRLMDQPSGRQPDAQTAGK